MGTAFALFMLIFFMTRTDEITVINVWFLEFILIGFIGCIILQGGGIPPLLYLCIKRKATVSVVKLYTVAISFICETGRYAFLFSTV